MSCHVRRTDHNFVADGPDLGTGTIRPGEAATATFTVPDGAIDYVCTFHPGMDGTITATSS